jgi:hypothetical protein
MSLTQNGIGRESDRLAHERGRRVTQKRDAKNNHPERPEVIDLNYAHGKGELVVDDIGAEVDVFGLLV